MHNFWIPALRVCAKHKVWDVMSDHVLDKLVDTYCDVHNPQFVISETQCLGFWESLACHMVTPLEPGMLAACIDQMVSHASPHHD